MARILSILVLVIITSSCKQSSDFKEIRDFNNAEWFIAHKQTFEFEIKDTVSTYRLNYLVRNSISYPFYNLYLQQRLQDSSGTTVLSSSMDEVILFDPKTGKPYGDGMGDIFDSRIQAPKLQAMQFKKPGKYKWVLNHNMRPDPLTGIMSLGVEVLKNE